MTWFSYVNFVDGATLTASNEAGGLLVRKLAFLPSTERWRAIGLAATGVDVDLDVDFGVDRRPEVRAFLRPRRRLELEERDGVDGLAATDPIRDRLAATDDFAADLYADGAGFAASDMAPGYGLGARFLPDPGGAAGRYARATFRATSRATAPDDWFDLGFAWYGRVDFEPSIDIGAPHDLIWDEPATERISDDGSAVIVRRKAMRRRMTLNFRAIKAAEVAGLERFLAWAGRGGVFLVGLERPDDPGADIARTTMFARLTAASQQRVAKRLWRAPLQIIEAI